MNYIVMGTLLAIYYAVVIVTTPNLYVTNFFSLLTLFVWISQMHTSETCIHGISHVSPCRYQFSLVCDEFFQLLTLFVWISNLVDMDFPNYQLSEPSKEELMN